MGTKNKYDQKKRMSEDDSRQIRSFGAYDQRNTLIVKSNIIESVDLEVYTGTQKVDTMNRPIFVFKEGKIVIEAFSPLSKHAQDFLIAISEPLTRPLLVHEYQITEYSLYAAVSIGLEGDDIIQTLKYLSKFDIPLKVIEFIRNHTKYFGKVKYILRNGKYFIETLDRQLTEIVSNEANAKVEQPAKQEKTMTLTMQFPPEIEAQLTTQARLQGLEAAQIVEKLAAKHLPPAPLSDAERERRRRVMEKLVAETERLGLYE